MAFFTSILSSVISCPIYALPAKDITPIFTPRGASLTKSIAVCLATVILSGSKSSASILSEASITITKEKELDCLNTCKVNPEIAKIINATISKLKKSAIIFLEKKSTPCILEIASKLANLNATFFLLLKE